MIRGFYHGNQFYAFVTETYKDVRLVGTPPESIGKFGADTDNWIWPRHTGDFSLFRCTPMKIICLLNIRNQTNHLSRDIFTDIDEWGSARRFYHGFWISWKDQ